MLCQTCLLQHRQLYFSGCRPLFLVFSSFAFLLSALNTICNSYHSPQNDFQGPQNDFQGPLADHLCSLLFASASTQLSTGVVQTRVRSFRAVSCGPRLHKLSKLLGSRRNLAAETGKCSGPGPACCFLHLRGCEAPARPPHLQARVCSWRLAFRAQRAPSATSAQPGGRHSSPQQQGGAAARPDAADLLFVELADEEGAAAAANGTRRTFLQLD